MKFDRFAYFFGALIAIGLAVALRIDAPLAEAAFGVSPPWVRNDHLLPGTTFEQIINLSRNDASRDMMVTVDIDGDKEIEKWLKIENYKSLIIKKGQKILPMKVIVKVPRRAAIKEYRGGIHTTLESIPEDGSLQGGSVAIKLGAHISVKLNVVGDKVTDFKIKSIYVDKLSDKDDFYLNVDIENLGNTEISQLDGQVDIYDKKEENVLKSFTFKDLEDVVLPDSITKTKIVYYGVSLDPGEYWVVAKAYKDGETVYENRLYQKVEARVVPVVTPEDVGVKKPSIPKLSLEAVEITEESKEDGGTADVTLRTAAPAGPLISTPLFILILAGIAFGFIGLVAIIILLVVLIKNQRQAAIHRYLTQQNTPNNPNE